MLTTDDANSQNFHVEWDFVKKVREASIDCQMRDENAWSRKVVEPLLEGAFKDRPLETEFV